MQLAYNQRFPKARQHIAAVPPISENHVNLNKHLQKISSFTECNFISTKAFIDKSSGKLRSGLMNGIHYNEVGIRILAKEMKKSLYSDANIGNCCLTTLNNLAQPYGNCTF